MPTIGLIGLGNIGAYFCEQFMKHGYPLIVLDLDPEKVAAAVKQGAVSAKTPGEIAQAADVIVLALPGSKPVENVMDGQHGILRYLREGQLLIDTGTTKPETDIRYERLCREKGAALIDAPITWRGKGLIVMAGGREEDYEKARPVLDCVSYKHRHVGTIGQGQMVKLVNQMVLANQVAVWSEAIEFANVNRVDPRLLQDLLEFSVPDGLYGDDFSGGGHLALHYKDLGYLLEAAHDSGAHIPLSSLVHEIFKATKPYGDPNWRQIGIVTYWRRLHAAGRTNREPSRGGSPT